MRCQGARSKDAQLTPLSPAEEPTGEPDYTREKNRLHYTHQNICVDLTQVHSADKVCRLLSALPVCRILTSLPPQPLPIR